MITPNPFTSGGARWNIMAAYGQVIENGGSEEEALTFVEDMLRNTVVQDASARDSLNTFLGGQGDVALSYENEAIGAIDAGEELEYTVPDDTILIETLGVDPDRCRERRRRRPRSATSSSPRRVRRCSPRAATARSTRRSWPSSRTSSRTRPACSTIEEFGGWETVATEFFDPENGKVADVEAELGVPLE